MFTLGYLYVFFYLFIFLSLLVFSFKKVPVTLVTHYSLPNFSVFLFRYIPSKNLFFFSVFALTGLPPLGLFFVKFNILIYILYQTHFFISIVIFFMFFFNMIYYIQLFNFRNSKKTSYPVVSPSIFFNWSASNANCWGQTTYRTYSLTLFIVNVLMLVFLTFVFFADYYSILSIIF